MRLVFILQVNGRDRLAMVDELRMQWLISLQLSFLTFFIIVLDNLKKSILKNIFPEWIIQEDFKDRIFALAEQLYTVQTPHRSQMNTEKCSKILLSQLNYHVWPVSPFTNKNCTETSFLLQLYDFQKDSGTSLHYSWTMWEELDACLQPCSALGS